MAKKRNKFNVGDIVKFDYSICGTRHTDWLLKRQLQFPEPNIGTIVKVVNDHGVVKMYEVLWFQAEQKELISSSFLIKLS
jgi:hypothetical protein